MKYMKLYENYENTSNDDILNCFQDLIDDRFDVNCSTRYLYITRDGGFTIDDVKETLLFAIPYMKSEYGINVESIWVGADLCGATLYDNKTFNNFNEFYKEIKSDYIIGSIMIYVY